ncbi:MAG: MBL fold metallo-hydrolase [Euryarchaeota archaeon]|nr:MBL fold metallo-hydrolase [Euryarchaeota archaeon]
MRIYPVVADSMGVRALSVFIETRINIFIDPSAALGPRRYGLAPKPVEWAALEKFKSEIRELAKKTDVFVISHYHYDHYDPNEDFFAGKKVFAKHWREKINYSQKKRAAQFHEKFSELCELEYVDGKKYEIEGVELKFSHPFPHGNEKTRLGFVIMTTVDDGTQRVLHASDVEGPIVEEAADYIISEAPDIAIIDGPATYFLGYRFSQSDLDRSIKNLKRIAENVPTVILDHHLLRDLKYRQRLGDTYSHLNLYTFAEFRGEKNNMLEARRKEL